MVVLVLFGIVTLLYKKTSVSVQKRIVSHLASCLVCDNSTHLRGLLYILPGHWAREEADKEENKAAIRPQGVLLLYFPLYRPDPSDLNSIVFNAWVNKSVCSGKPTVIRKKLLR